MLPTTLESLVRTAFLAVAALVLAVPPSWSANPEFEGTWKMDRLRSDPMNQQGLMVDNSYTLALDGEDLKAKRTFFRQGQAQSIDWVFYTDGKPYEIPGMLAPRKARVKWKKNKLSVSYTMTRETPRGGFDLDVVETWQINKVGELEIRYSTRVGERNRTRKEIYVRQKDG